MRHSKCESKRSSPSRSVLRRLMRCDCEHLQGSRDRTRKVIEQIPSGGSIRGEACERAQSETCASPPLSSKFKQRCDLVKRSCLANRIQSNRSCRQCEDPSSWQMRREAERPN